MVSFRRQPFPYPRPGRRIRSAAAIAVAGVVLISGCEFPADPEGTLDRATGGTLTVGVVENEPWVVLDPGEEPAGVEPELVRGFAETIDSEVEWIEGSADELAAAMGGFQLDIIIGGLTRDFPYPDDVTMTRPFIDTEIEIGLPPGEELPDSLDGERIWVARGSEAAALLREEENGAVDVRYERTSEIDGLVLTDDFRIEALGYERSDYILRDNEHAMAAPLGENAFLTELERYLLDRGDVAQELLEDQTGIRTP